MYTCEEILGTQSAVVDLMAKTKEFLKTQNLSPDEKVEFADRYQRDLHGIAVSLERLCRECSVDQIRSLSHEIAEVKKWLNALEQKAE